MQGTRQDSGLLPTFDPSGSAESHGFGTDGSGAAIGEPMNSPLEAGGVHSSGVSKGKKRKSEVLGDGQKKTRQSQSCDACRVRKVKCDRIPPGKPGAEIREICTHCQQLNLPCTFNYQPKKRGPPNQYLKRLQENDKSESPSGTALPSFLEPTISGDTPLPVPFDSETPQVGYSPPTRSESRRYEEEWERRHLYHSESASRDPRPESSNMTAPPRDVWGAERTWDTRTASPIAIRQHADRPLEPVHPFYDTPSTGEFSRSPAFNLGSLHPSSYRSSSQTSPSTFLSPHTVPSRPNNPFDEVIPRHLLLLVIDLYFQYIYGLVPCIHRPSFMRDLHAYKEENVNDESAEEWRALVMCLVAFTLVQIPRAFVPLKRKQVKATVDVTQEIANRWLNRWASDDMTVTRHVIIYMSAVTCTLLNRRIEGIELAGRNWALIVRRRCNMEETYKSISNPIERELTRRMFWLVHGGDVSLSVIEGVSLLASESSCADVALPSTLEDEYITDQGLLEKKDDQPSILTGFYYISKLFRLTGQVLDKKQLDRRTPPSGLLLQMQINEINGLYDQVMSLMDGCPPELRLEEDSSPRSAVFSDDWDLAAVKELRHFMLDPSANRSAVKDAFLVQQANIYVTQQMTRFVLLQYRDDLLALQQDELARTTQADGDLQRFSAARRMERAPFSDEEKEKVASDLLMILQKIPITVIAVNSLPLVFKVRFVASTLLDALEVPGSSNTAERSGKVQRAQRYLWDFLRILADIEALYSMDD